MLNVGGWGCCIYVGSLFWWVDVVFLVKVVLGFGLKVIVLGFVCG